MDFGDLQRIWVLHANAHNSELLIRGGIWNNSKIFFSYFSMKTYIVTPH